MAVAALAGLIVLSLIVAAVLANRTSAPASSTGQQQGALETYTSSIADLLQVAAPTAGQMAAAPANAGDPGVGQLAGSSKKWDAKLADAEKNAGQVFPVPQVVTAQRLFSESIHLFSSAAKTYGLVPTVPASARGPLLQRAADQRDQANFIWQAGVELLDKQRALAKLGPSGLAAPIPAQPAAPSPQPSSGKSGAAKKQSGSKSGGGSSKSGGKSGNG